MVSASSSPRCLHIIVSAMLCFLPSLKPVNETCYVYMVAIISSGPFWLMVSKCRGIVTADVLELGLSRGAIATRKLEGVMRDKEHEGLYWFGPLR